MNDQKRTDIISNQVWRSCDALRGATASMSCRDYILTMLFVKYLNDVHRSNRIALEKKYKNEPVRVERALGRARFVTPRIEIRDEDGIVEDVFEATYQSLYERRTRPDIGELINLALARIEDANKGKLHNVFHNVDFNSEAHLGRARQRNDNLKKLLEGLNGIDLGIDDSDRDNTIGEVYEALIEKFAGAGRTKEEFYTPADISEVLVRLVNPQPGDRICDPACGSGSLLIRAGKQAGLEDCTLFGQEINGGVWTLCKINMFLNGVDTARIMREDTLRHPQFIDEAGALMKFDAVIGHPPFSLDKWGQEIAPDDRYGRFNRGIPPKSKGDWAFISHMLATAMDGKGRVGVVAPHGVLFRAGREGRIREAVIRENLLDGVVGLPANAFFHTDIPAVLLVFDKSRSVGKKGSVLFMDASRDFGKGTARNQLRPRDIEKIIGTYRQRRAVEGYSRPVTCREIQENGFNLNIPLYVDALGLEPPVDVRTVQEEITAIEAELAEIREKLGDGLKALRGSP